ncbi:MAG: hypothetical protein ACR2GD_09700 [Pyrinomonadaceae bacterium]
MKKFSEAIFVAYRTFQTFTKKSKSYKAVKYLLITVFTAYGLIIIFPQFLFAHEVSYKNFNVYARQPLDENVYRVLDAAEARLLKSPIYDKRQTEKIFISDSFSFYNLLSPTSRKSFANTLPGIGNIRINQSDIERDLVFRDAAEYNQRSLSGVIAHEVTHNLVRRKFGLLNSFVSLPKWKDEGYSEYVTGETTLSFDEGVQLWKENQADDSKYNYFKYQQMVKYLLDDEKISVEELFTKDFDEKELSAKVFAKINQN